MTDITKAKYHLEYIDSCGEKHIVQFFRKEYNNLMELLWDRTIEDWGDCKGRAWCGSCHIKATHTRNKLEKIDQEENACLQNQENRVNSSRLACQIELTNDLDGAIIQYLGDT